MSSEDLLNTLEDLTDDELKHFKWYLKQPDVRDGYQTIKVSKLEKTDRRDIVDLMVNTYKLHGALKVTKKVLEKINRNDLVQSLSETSSGPEVAVQNGVSSNPQLNDVTAGRDIHMNITMIQPSTRTEETHEVSPRGDQRRENTVTVPARHRGPAEDIVPAEEKLLSFRRQFKDRVSRPVLNGLLDELLERGVINDSEMEYVREMTSRADKAQELIDMVRRKGPAASSILIEALRQCDPFLSAELFSA